MISDPIANATHQRKKKKKPQALQRKIGVYTAIMHFTQPNHLLHDRVLKHTVVTRKKKKHLAIKRFSELADRQEIIFKGRDVKDMTKLETVRKTYSAGVCNMSSAAIG